MALKITNNASSTLAANIGTTDTSLAVAAGDGAQFPILAEGDWFPATIVDAEGDREIIQVTARDTDTFTVVRGQDNTVAQSFAAGCRIDLRLTAGAIGALLQSGNNLSDVSNAATARTNLGIAPSAATGEANTLSGLAFVALSGDSADLTGGVQSLGGDLALSQVPDALLSYSKMQPTENNKRVLGKDNTNAATVSGAASNGNGMIRLTVDSTAAMTSGQSWTVANVVGTTEANAAWTITVVGATHVDLVGSTFTHAYTSGGVVSVGTSGVAITGAASNDSGTANNGGGQIRLTVTSTETMTTGEVWGVAGVGGTTEANGRFSVDVIDATHVDLVGTTFQNAYTSGGIIGTSVATISAAAGNGTGLVRLTVNSTATLLTGQTRTVAGIVGTTEANGTYVIDVVDATHVDLRATAYANGYISGGYIEGGALAETDLSDLLDFISHTGTITGAANNGSGEVRLTVDSTALLGSGESWVVAGVVGTTEANGTWVITVIDGTHVDLNGSDYANAYSNGGTISAAMAEGDMLVRTASGWKRLPAGAQGDVLTSTGQGQMPGWVGGVPYVTILGKPPLSPFTDMVRYVVTSDNQLWAVGTNSSSQNGYVDAVTYTPLPVSFDNAPASITKVFQGPYSTYILDSAGNVFAIGDNTYGQLGTGDTNQRNIATRIAYFATNNIQIADIIVSGNTVSSVGVAVLFITTAGAVYGCGYNGSGGLGIGNTTTPIETPTITNITSGASGGCVAACASIGVTSFIVKTDGTLWAAGYNGGSSFGNGTTTNASAFAQVLTGVQKAICIQGYVSNTTYSSWSIALKTNGTLWATGANGAGQLGQGNTTTLASWTQIGTETNWTDFTANDYYGFVAALNSAGQVWTWGDNAYGQLGLGDTTTRETPEQPTFSGTAVAILACSGSGFGELFVRDASGNLWACGYSTNGNLGINSVAASNPSFTKLQAPAGKTFSDWAIFGNGSTTGIVILWSDGTVSVAGASSGGALGLGNNGGISRTLKQVPRFA